VRWKKKGKENLERGSLRKKGLALLSDIRADMKVRGTNTIIRRRTLGKGREKSETGLCAAERGERGNWDTYSEKKGKSGGWSVASLGEEKRGVFRFPDGAGGGK